MVDAAPKQPSWRTDKRKTAERGYGAAWQRARARYLHEHPLCVMCLAATPKRLTAATVVDHRIPHKGDIALFWDETNWQALCKPHHDSDKQMLEKSGRVRQTIGLDGWPVEQG